MESPLQPSIDAVVHASTENVTITNSDTQTPQPDGIQEPPVKLGGRKRLLMGLQRISSSPSLAKMGRGPSGYRTGQRGSMSCVSLASSSNYNGLHYSSSYESEFGPQFSTAPTSVPGTPGSATPNPELHRPRARTIGHNAPTSVGLPSEMRPASRRVGKQEVGEEDYFSKPAAQLQKPPRKRRKNFNFWREMPSEIRMQILTYLSPKEIVKCSVVSKSWHKMCFDGQLWKHLDTSEFYRDIPADTLIKVIASAGPFVRDLNLRGCVQLREKWCSRGLPDACRNLENLSLEGCLIDRCSIHGFMISNSRLVHINLSGLSAATNTAMKIIGQHCPKVEHLNVTWCNNLDTKGLRRVVEGCPNLKDLRAGEVRGWDDTAFMNELFKRNTVERLILTNCDTLSDEAFTVLLEGFDPEYDFLTDRVVVPPRRLRHLDLTRCRSLTDASIKKLAHNVPLMEGLQLSKNHSLTDDSLTDVLPTLPNLTHLDLEELDSLTNLSLQTLANSSCKSTLQHLSISYCENLGDAGMLPVLKACTKLSSLDMDNTRVSDLCLTEAAASIRARNRLAGRGLSANERPTVGLKLVAYDCANVTWTGVREVLSRNAEVTRPIAGGKPTYPQQIIQLKCFYNWQPTVEEHTKRVLRGDFAAAAKLERKWAEWMILNEEAGAGGGRRRRRRAREAQLLHAAGLEGDEEAGGGVRVGRRRARSGPTGCVVM
jgi:F-box and leucine-rich repeat protein 2/20